MGDSCFSIYQINSIKIKKELFVHKTRHLEFVYVSIDSQFQRPFFMILLQIQKIFFYRPVNTDKPNFVSFLVLFSTAALFTAKISSFKTVAKQEAILNPFPKHWISEDIPSYGSQSEHVKIAIHWFGEY